jgi:cell division transport system permease protein
VTSTRMTTISRVGAAQVPGSVPDSGEDVARPTASNPWRNRLMAMAAVLTAAISLSLVGAALLFWPGAADASAAPKRGTEVTVWMRSDANAQEIHAVGTRLSKLSNLRQPCTYWNKARNLAEARKLLPADVGGGALNVKDMPTSFWCTPVVLTDANQLIRTMNGVPGVETVTVGPNRSEPRRR